MDYSHTVKSVAYADAETRRRLREWKQKLAREYEGFHNGYQALAREGAQMTLDLALRNNRKGRERALEKITKALAPARLERARLDKRKQSFALFSILKPRESMLLPGQFEDEAEEASRTLES